jgi:hypothetical protein
MAVLVAARGRARRSRIPRFESRPSAVLTSSPPETYQELVQVRYWKMLGSGTDKVVQVSFRDAG